MGEEVRKRHETAIIILKGTSTRHYVTNRKVAGSIPDEVIFFKFT
jgi:hypothetical protein